LQRPLAEQTHCLYTLLCEQNRFEYRFILCRLEAATGHVSIRHCLKFYTFLPQFKCFIVMAFSAHLKLVAAESSNFLRRITAIRI